MRTRTNLFFISLLCGACSNGDLPPSPYGGGGFGQGVDPIGGGDGGGSDASGGGSTDAGSVADAGAEDGGEEDGGSEGDAGRPDVPPLVPKTDCDPPRVLDRTFDPQTGVGFASNGKGTAALSWTSGDPAKQYASAYRDGIWQSKQQLATGAMSSATLGVDDIGSAYAFWWSAAGLTGRKLDTAEKTWTSSEELDKNATIPVRPWPYAVSANGTCLFVREGIGTRSIVRYGSDLSLRDEVAITPPDPTAEPEELTHLLTNAIGQAIVLTTWRMDGERRLVPYFQDKGQLKNSESLVIPDGLTTDQLSALVTPSGDLAVVAAELTDKDARLWTRTVSRSNGRWSKERVLEKRNIEGRRFAFRKALVDARGKLTVAWIDDEEVMVSQERDGVFSDPIALGADDPDSAVFSLDLDGNLSVVYSDNRGLSLRQLSARSGTFFPPIPLGSYVPRLAYVTHDAQGNVIAAWEEEGLRARTCREQTVGE